MNNRIFSVVLLIMVGMLTGLAILFSVSLALNNAMIPIRKDLYEIRLTLNELKSNAGSGSGMAGLEAKLTGIENRINALASAGARPAQPPQPMPPQEDLTKVHEIPVGESYVHGKKKAPVTIVEFVDFQCPFCARFYPPVLETLKAYPDQVNYVIKNYPLPFHPQAKPAAKAAMAAGEQGKYYEMAHELLNNAQNLSEDKFKELAKKLGLDEAKFAKDYADADGKYEAIISEDIALGQRVDVRGTPTFYINGKKTMARDFNSFKNEIDAILKGRK